MCDTGSTNTIDQLLSHSTGPTNPVSGRELTRARSSAYIVHGNFRELATICDDIKTTGLVVADASAEIKDVENEIYRCVHNYLSAFYSYNEQIRSTLSKSLGESIDKSYFLPARDNKSAPEYVRRGAFLWGLRNDFQHGDYWCLSVEQKYTNGEQAYYHLHFNKQDFEPTATENLDAAGAYLAHALDEEYQYPLPYIASFHQNLFNEFEAAFESWCSRNLL